MQRDLAGGSACEQNDGSRKSKGSYHETAGGR